MTETLCCADDKVLYVQLTAQSDGCVCGGRPGLTSSHQVFNLDPSIM